MKETNLKGVVGHSMSRAAEHSMSGAAEHSMRRANVKWVPFAKLGTRSSSIVGCCTFPELNWMPINLSVYQDPEL